MNEEMRDYAIRSLREKLLGYLLNGETDNYNQVRFMIMMNQELGLITEMEVAYLVNTLDEIKRINFERDRKKLDIYRDEQYYYDDYEETVRF